MGSAFRLPIVSDPDAARVIVRARAAGLRIVATVPGGGSAMHTADLKGPLALLVGGEGAGLATDVTERADERVTIPMRPPLESLNVAVATALLVYEAARQRSLLPQ
jgi:TrmH family RNA methyltransferase